METYFTDVFLKKTIKNEIIFVQASIVINFLFNIHLLLYEFVSLSNCVIKVIFCIILKSQININTPRYTEHLKTLKSLLVENSIQISNVKIKRIIMCLLST